MMTRGGPLCVAMTAGGVATPFPLAGTVGDNGRQ